MDCIFSFIKMSALALPYSWEDAKYYLAMAGIFACVSFGLNHLLSALSKLWTMMIVIIKLLLVLLVFFLFFKIVTIHVFPDLTWHSIQSYFPPLTQMYNDYQNKTEL